MSRTRSGNILIRDDGYRGGKLYANLGEIQAVWLVVTDSPAMSVRRIQAKLGMAKDRVWHILSFLEKAGYVKHDRQCTGRKVIIPFVMEKGTISPKEPTTEPEAR